MHITIEVPQLDRLAAAIEALAATKALTTVVEAPVVDAPAKRGRKPAPAPVVVDPEPEPAPAPVAEVVEAPKEEEPPASPPVAPEPAPTPVVVEQALAEPVPPPPAPASPSEAPAPALTLDDVRLRAVAWSKVHTRDEVIAILNQHGLTSLPQAKDHPDKWASLYAAYALEG